MTTAIQKQEDGTITLTITIPSPVIKKTREEVVDELVKNAEIKGFRKGKAPRSVVEENVKKDSLIEEILKKVLPKAYIDAVNEQKITPIMNPKIHIGEIGDFDKDWQFSAVTCEAPKVELNDYKEKVQKVTAKSKIALPGKEQQPVILDEIVKALLETVTIKVPKVLIDQEAERALSQTLDEIKRLGLTLDQYLASTGKSAETMRLDFEKKAQQDLKFEFALQKIAEAEKITVEEKELDEAVQKAKDENERKHLEQNRYLLAGILRQQKTLDFLKNL